MNTAVVLQDIAAEREAQDAKWGQQNHPDGTGSAWHQLEAERARARCQTSFRCGGGSWRHVLDEEVAEAFAETDPANLRAELIQVAAVAVAWVEAIDRRFAAGDR